MSAIVWAVPETAYPMIVEQFSDKRGTSLDPGNVGLLIGPELGFMVIESQNTDGLRKFALSILTECDSYDRDHK